MDHFPRYGWKYKMNHHRVGYNRDLPSWEVTYPINRALLSRCFSELPVWWDMLVPWRVKHLQKWPRQVFLSKGSFFDLDFSHVSPPASRAPQPSQEEALGGDPMATLPETDHGNPMFPSFFVGVHNVIFPIYWGSETLSFRFWGSKVSDTKIAKMDGWKVTFPSQSFQVR